MTTPNLPDEKSERQLLEERAAQLGIATRKNMSLEVLRSKVNEALTGDSVKVETEDKTNEKELRKLKAEATKLVRVIVIPNVPELSNRDGDIFTVSNSIVGSIRRFVPYNNPEGWHIENILYQTLKEKKAQTFVTKKKNGRDVTETVLVPAYNINVLDPLSKEELAELAKAQQARGSIDAD